jgi:hypothetical protein
MYMHTHFIHAREIFVLMDGSQPETDAGAILCDSGRV